MTHHHKNEFPRSLKFVVQTYMACCIKIIIIKCQWTKGHREYLNIAALRFRIFKWPDVGRAFKQVLSMVHWAHASQFEMIRRIDPFDFITTKRWADTYKKWRWLFFVIFFLANIEISLRSHGFFIYLLFELRFLRVNKRYTHNQKDRLDWTVKNDYSLWTLHEKWTNSFCSPFSLLDTKVSLATSGFFICSLFGICV